MIKRITKTKRIELIAPILSILAILFITDASAQNRSKNRQNKSNNKLEIYQKDYKEPIQTEKLVKFTTGDYTYNIYTNSSWTFYGNEKPIISLSARNNNYKKERINMLCNISRIPDKNILYSFMQEVAIAPDDSSLVSFTFNNTQPGIYSVELSAQKDDNTHFTYRYNIAYEPCKISSESVKNILPNMEYEPTYKAMDYTDSLSQAIKKLSGNRNENYMGIKREQNLAAPQSRMTKLNSPYNSKRDLYLVEIQGGRQQSIKGYYIEPQKRRNNPSIIRFEYCNESDYDRSLIHANENPNLAEFIVINPDKTYRYDELCADAIKIIDFVQSRKATANDKIFVEGNGKGAVVALTIAAIDKRVSGCALYSPDFTTEDLNNRDFNIPYIAMALKTPLLMEIQLQDSNSTVSRNYTGSNNNINNISSNSSPLNSFYLYNLVQSKKEYYLYTFKEDFNRLKWNAIELNFFEKYNNRH